MLRNPTEQIESNEYKDKGNVEAALGMLPGRYRVSRVLAVPAGQARSSDSSLLDIPGADAAGAVVGALLDAVGDLDGGGTGGGQGGAPDFAAGVLGVVEEALVGSVDGAPLALVGEEGRDDLAVGRRGRPRLWWRG